MLLLLAPLHHNPLCFPLSELRLLLQKPKEKEQAAAFSLEVSSCEEEEEEEEEEVVVVVVLLLLLLCCSKFCRIAEKHQTVTSQKIYRCDELSQE
jgi:hypothetical protein